MDRSLEQVAAEDLFQAVRSGRSVRRHGPYQVLIGDENLRFEPRLISDPTPTGGQILEAACVKSPVEFVVYQLHTGGLLEELGVELTTDLRDAGIERFIVMRTDRSFRLLLNDHACEWGVKQISGFTLKKIAGVDLEATDVWQEFSGRAPRLIEDTELVDLAEPGVERFVTRERLYKIIVNARPKEVKQSRLTFWEVVRLAFPQAAPSPTTYFTVTYKRGPISNPEGSMVDGQSVRIKDGMLFNVTCTDRS